MVAGFRQNKTVHLYDLDSGVFLLLHSTGRGRIKGKGHRFPLSVDSGKVLEDIRDESCCQGRLCILQPDTIYSVCLRSSLTSDEDRHEMGV